VSGTVWWTEIRNAAEKGAADVRTMGGARVDPVESAAFVQRFLLRTFTVVALQSKGWMTSSKGGDYWATFLRDGSSAYRVDQKLSLLFFSGLGQPSRRARMIVRSQIGEVPYLGSGLFCPDRLESDQPGGGEPATVPQTTIDWIMSEGFCSLADSVAVEADNPMRRSAPIGHLFDPQCGPGDRLVEAARTLVVEDEAAGRTPCSAIDDLLSGMDADPLNVQTARFRLALVALLAQTGSEPVPLPDLRKVVRVGSASPMEGATLVEGPRVEFKAAFDWNSSRGERSAELRMGVLRTIVGFMNSEGGTLYIGMSDDGTVTGIQEELRTLQDPHPQDVFEGRVREAIKNHIEPLPLQGVQLRFIQVSGQVIVEIQVSPRAGVTYLVRKGADGRPSEEIHVRDGNRTLNLSGRARDRFVAERSAGSGLTEFG